MFLRSHWFLLLLLSLFSTNRKTAKKPGTTPTACRPRARSTTSRPRGSNSSASPVVCRPCVIVSEEYTEFFYRESITAKRPRRPPSSAGLAVSRGSWPVPSATHPLLSTMTRTSLEQETVVSMHRNLVRDAPLTVWRVSECRTSWLKSINGWKRGGYSPCLPKPPADVHVALAGRPYLPLLSPKR